MVGEWEFRPRWQVAVLNLPHHSIKNYPIKVTNGIHVSKSNNIPHLTSSFITLSYLLALAIPHLPVFSCPPCNASAQSLRELLLPSHHLNTGSLVLLHFPPKWQWIPNGLIQPTPLLWATHLGAKLPDDHLTYISHCHSKLIFQIFSLCHIRFTASIH